MSWSPDGRFIAFGRRGPTGSLDLWAVPVFGDDRTPFPIVQTGGADMSASFSPNGRWVAFSSNESGIPRSRFAGQSNIFVQPFPGPGLKRPVSKGGGGNYPVWRADGKELFYIANNGALDGTLMSVPLDAAGEYQGAASQPLFRPSVPRFTAGHIYAVTRDGQRFLVNSRPEEINFMPLTVIVNWPATVAHQ